MAAHQQHEHGDHDERCEDQCDEHARARQLRGQRDGAGRDQGLTRLKLRGEYSAPAWLRSCTRTRYSPGGASGPVFTGTIVR